MRKLLLSLAAALTLCFAGLAGLPTAQALGLAPNQAVDRAAAQTAAPLEEVRHHRRWRRHYYRPRVYIGPRYYHRRYYHRRYYYPRRHYYPRRYYYPRRHYYRPYYYW